MENNKETERKIKENHKRAKNGEDFVIHFAAAHCLLVRIDKYII
jgi:hypothetical protein